MAMIESISNLWKYIKVVNLVRQIFLPQFGIAGCPKSVLRHFTIFGYQPHFVLQQNWWLVMIVIHRANNIILPLSSELLHLGLLLESRYLVACIYTASSIIVIKSPDFMACPSPGHGCQVNNMDCISCNRWGGVPFHI